jgi:hypothetical protein
MRADDGGTPLFPTVEATVYSAREVVGGAEEGHVVGPTEDGGASSIPLNMKETEADAFLASSSGTPTAGQKTASVSWSRQIPSPVRVV